MYIMKFSLVRMAFLPIWDGWTLIFFLPLLTIDIYGSPDRARYRVLPIYCGPIYRRIWYSGCRNNAVQYSMILHHCSYWGRIQTRVRTHKKTTHTSPKQASFGVSFVRIINKNWLCYNGTMMYIALACWTPFFYYLSGEFLKTWQPRAMYIFPKSC